MAEQLLSNDEEEKSQILKATKSAVLTEEEFPLELADVFAPIPTFHKQAANLTELKPDQDRREFIQGEGDNKSFLSRLGQLTLQFDDQRKKVYNGTGTVFAINENENSFYVVTCAHNVILHHPMNGDIKIKKGWFNRRITNSVNDRNKVSQIRKSYIVQNYWTHPKYDPSKYADENDLAILVCKDSDNYYTDNLLDLSGLSPGMPETQKDIVYVYGYPASKKGELWGMKGEKNEIKVSKLKPNLFEYVNIDTSGGQSGSPIFVSSSQTIIHFNYVFSIMALFFTSMTIFCGNLGLEFGASFDTSILLVIITIILMEINNFSLKETKNECNIIGVHTTGSAEGNYGVKLTSDSLKWINSCIDNQTGEGQTTITDKLYCLKEEDFSTPFI